MTKLGLKYLIMESRLFLVLMIFALLSSCGSEKSWNFLEGTWKVETEGRTQFECWEVDKDGNFIGHSYEMMDGEKMIFENMTITEEGDDVFLNPIVEGQNDGNAINFKLNKEEEEWLSFENPEHDFPNTVRYQKVTDDRLNVEVLGSEGRGFSMVYIREK
jgi:hypothetical protein